MDVFFAGLIVGAMMTVGLLFVLRIVHPWLKAAFSGARVPMSHVIGMRLRGTPAPLLVDAYVLLAKQAQPVSLSVVEVCYMTNRLKITTPEQLAEHALQECERSAGTPEAAP